MREAYVCLEEVATRGSVGLRCLGWEPPDNGIPLPVPAMTLR